MLQENFKVIYLLNLVSKFLIEILNTWGNLCSYIKTRFLVSSTYLIKLLIWLMVGKLNLFLSVRKANVIKYILQAIPIYTMSSYKISTTVWKTTDFLTKFFWWNFNSQANRYSALKRMGYSLQTKKPGWPGL